MADKEIKEYNENGNMIHYKNSDGEEAWYANNGNLIYRKYDDGEAWYDKHGNIIKYTDINGRISWTEFNNRGDPVHVIDSEGFESWREYDENGNIIHYKNSDGEESWHEYDNNGKCIHYKNSEGHESWRDNNKEYNEHNDSKCERYNKYGNMIYKQDENGKTWWNNKGLTICRKFLNEVSIGIIQIYFLIHITKITKYDKK